jgi:hypothetical protein
MEPQRTGQPSQFYVQVTPRVNIGNDVSPNFAVRDSAQVATRVVQPECGPDFTNNLGLSETRDHCDGMSSWDVAGGGRMGMVTGEAATEVANRRPSAPRTARRRTRSSADSPPWGSRCTRRPPAG